MKHIVGRQKVGILRVKHARNLNIYICIMFRFTV